MKSFCTRRFLAAVLTVLLTIGLAGCQSPVASSSAGAPESTAATESASTTASLSSTAAEPSEQPTTTQTDGGGKTSATTRQTTQTTQSVATRPSDRKTSNQVFFGYYGLTVDPLELDTSSITYSETDYVNVMLAGSSLDEVVYALKLAKKNNCRVWINIHSALFSSPSTLSGQWEKRFDEVDAAARNSGAYDCLLGYYLDEPLLCGISHADLLAVTKYNKQQFGKRFFICFAVSGVAPEVWNSPDASPAITKETGKYITDIAFDMYWDFKQHKATYDRVIDGMKTRIGRDDVKVWYVPCVMNPSGSFNETQAIEHLQGMYEYLKQEKNPGGLLCYTLRTHNGDGLGNVGMDEMEDAPWNKLRAECVKIGREISSGKLDK